MIDFGSLPQGNVQPAPQETKIHATIKFTGGDWLVAEVSNILDNKIHLQLADGSPLVVDRSQVEWIYLAKGPAPECYEGPTSLSGWSYNGGGWSSPHDGALAGRGPYPHRARTSARFPTRWNINSRWIRANLASSFNFTLHGRVGVGWNGAQRMLQCALRANPLNVYTNPGGNNFRSQQVNLPKALADAIDGRLKPGKANPSAYAQVRRFHRRKIASSLSTARKLGTWEFEKGESGTNADALQLLSRPFLTPTMVQTLSKVRVMPWDGQLPDETAPN